MAFSTGSGSHAAAINVTPLIDVLLVLLIIFMVIVPTVPRGLGSSVPQPPSEKANAAPSEPPAIVELLPAKAGVPVRFRLGSKQGEMPELRQALGAMLATRVDRNVFVRGDRSLELATVAEAISAAHSAGASQVGILSDGMPAK